MVAATVNLLAEDRDGKGSNGSRIKRLFIAVVRAWEGPDDRTIFCSSIPDAATYHYTYASSLILKHQEYGSRKRVHIMGSRFGIDMCIYNSC
jgi:hypothetical protein